MTEGERPRKRRPYPCLAPKSWKTAESFGVTRSRNSKYRQADCHSQGFWVTVGKGSQYCNKARPSGCLHKHVFCNVKGQTIGQLLRQLDVEQPLSHLAIQVSLESQYCKSQALVLLIHLCQLTVTSSQLLEHVCNNPQGLNNMQGLRERERERGRVYCKKAI